MHDLHTTSHTIDLCILPYCFESLKPHIAYIKNRSTTPRRNILNVNFEGHTYTLDNTKEVKIRNRIRRINN